MNLASLPGVVLDGKYRIERQLGKGGMGAVFLAIHLGTTRTVAVKVIVPQFAAQDEFLFRFQREAEAAGRLRHPNVVNVTDFGSTIAGGAPLAYLVMEFLDGQNLSDFLDATPRPASDEILEIVDQVALALDTAHANGIVHRDLKPDNIWLQPNHRGGFNVKVLDFGIAKLHNPTGTGGLIDMPKPSIPLRTVLPAPESETLMMAPTEVAPTQAAPLDAETLLTHASLRPQTPSAGSSLRLSSFASLETTVGSVLGTPAYMAPEQCQGANVDASADIYSLAVIVYQMFCGCLPFEAKNLKEMLQKQIEEMPIPPSVRDPGVSRRVSEIIMRGLAKLPADRPQSVLGFAAQLRAASEAELKLLADGKVVASNHGNTFFPLLAACFLPYLPATFLLYLVARAVSHKVPAGVLAVTFQASIFTILFFLSQCYKAGTTFLLNEAAAAGHFEKQWRKQYRRLIRNLRPLLAMHLRNTFDLRPRSLLSGQLWPVVWASESLSGKAAIDRAFVLGTADRPATAALAVRQWSILLATTFLIPCVLALAGARSSDYVQLLAGSIGAFAIISFYPFFLSLMLFRFFGPAFFFLYVSARRCMGEAVDFSLPSASRERRSRRAWPLRPATTIWAALPLLLGLAVLYKSIPRGDTRFDLFDAASEGRKAAALRAIDAGLSVNLSDRRDLTPLMYAVTRGDLEFTRELIARHADLNARESNGNTALMLAAWYRQPAAAELLIAAGANLQVANDDGRTALFPAAMHGDAAMCRLLLSHGADRTHRDQKGKTPLDYAREENHSDVVELLSAPVN